MTDFSGHLRQGQASDVRGFAVNLLGPGFYEDLDRHGSALHPAIEN